MTYVYKNSSPTKRLCIRYNNIPKFTTNFPLMPILPGYVKQAYEQIRRTQIWDTFNSFQVKLCRKGKDMSFCTFIFLNIHIPVFYMANMKRSIPKGKEKWQPWRTPLNNDAAFPGKGTLKITTCYCTGPYYF